MSFLIKLQQILSLFWQNVFFHIWILQAALKTLKTLLRGHMLLVILKANKLLKLYKKELQKTNQNEFRVEKVIKRKGDKLYAKWKSYDNSFNSCIDKKDIV